MKRKLDEHDAPTVEVPAADSSNNADDKSSFESFGLDPRLLQAIAKSNFTTPTPIQAQAIPLALQGKDILAQSSTGSGKTVTYVVPALQALLHRKAGPGNVGSATTVLVLVPTRELADQVQKAFVSLSAYCPKQVKSINMTQRVSDAVLDALLSDNPDIVVSTPGRANNFLSTGSLSLAQITHLVIDEADLVLSYGYEDDIEAIAKAIPPSAQAFLMSATLTSDIDALKQTLCRDPTVIRIQDKEEQTENMTQYVVKCAEDEKFLLVFVIFKLKLVRGKTIIFVDDIERSYRLRLYLEQFGIKACILNSELPVNSRLHVVQEFNKGLYDIIIAADDQEILGGVHKPQSRPPAAPKDDDGSANEADLLSSDDEIPSTASANKRTKTTSRDYGVSRGIDFQNVSCVLNFDLPHTSKAYTHRIGRTARAGKSGMAMSFVIPASQHHKHPPTSIPSTKHDEAVLAKIIRKQTKLGRTVTDHNFDPAQIDAFRYRVNDAIRAVTKLAIREARAREIKDELIKSEKLRKHFEDNPEDLRHLRHDLESGGARVQRHLRHVPEYLLPESARKAKSLDVGFVGLRKDGRDAKKGSGGGGGGGRGRGRGRGGRGGGAGRRVDPLKSFKRK
jgi:ATP-dependent RNA helicase DDX56/DBP9